MNRLFTLWSKSDKPKQERRNSSYRTPRPLIGQHIACQYVMLKVTAPIGIGLWEDLLSLGWRTVDPATDRRNYATLPPEAFDDLLLCDRAHLLDTHRALMLRKPHPLGVAQPRPAPDFPGLPSEVHWAGGAPDTDTSIEIHEADYSELNSSER